MFADVLFVPLLLWPLAASSLTHRDLHFEPPMLDFSEHPVGTPKREKVHLHNPSPEEISLVSISGSTAHFQASFFQHAILPPGGTTWFHVVFLARVVGNIENTLFVNTSHHGLFTYQVVEVSSSGGDLHLELPTGQHPHTDHLWSVRTSPPNRAISVEFKAVTLKGHQRGPLRTYQRGLTIEDHRGPSRTYHRGPTKVASITFDASKAARPAQWSGKVVIKVTGQGPFTLEISYQADVLVGYLGLDHATTLFHIRNSPLEPVVRSIFLTNTFSYPVQILNTSLNATTVFTVQNQSAVVLPAQGSRYVFSLVFRPVRPSVLTNILLMTNLSRFHLPVLSYTGLLEVHFYCS
ncbi:hypothetical protein NHX12_033692 [Muraenolepis orangiensis]|uniref:Transmembrane protein 131-like N-terminal domain-containing protein n=1 Tax=Muraenolepis orangiensis TaxID=630683 RepID=A0A9Q0E3V9_9TELE|nr:hypothetical protein NHX12_033692 [Muraenolepis orangiensis]